MTGLVDASSSLREEVMEVSFFVYLVKGSAEVLKAREAMDKEEKAR